MGRTQVIHAGDVIEARKRLKEISDASPADAPFLDADGDAAWEPAVLCEATTWEDFQRWLNMNEGRIRQWVFEPLAEDPDRGRVVIYSLPSIPHERATHSIKNSIIEQIQTLGNVGLIRTIDEGQPTCTIGTAGQEPDASMTPVGLTIGCAVLECLSGFPFPNLVIEVAYKNLSLDALRTKLTRWMSAQTSVQVAIGVKIASNSQSRVSILCQRGLPDQVVEFGEDHHPGAAPLALTFPLASIYFGVGLPQAMDRVINPQISIDLIDLRTQIDEWLAQEQAAQQIRAQERARYLAAQLRALQATRVARRRARARAAARAARAQVIQAARDAHA